jgi:hypothetical protein
MALREEALYEYGGGPASLRQAIQYESGAIAASTFARDRLYRPEQRMLALQGAPPVAPRFRDPFR